MAKPLVVRSDERAPVPFLRGILTRSLQKAGLPFEDAYRIAAAVRDDLRDATEVSPAEIEAKVLPRLDRYGEAVKRRYRTRTAVPPLVIVRHADGHEEPFSRGRWRVALSPCGLSSEAATKVVERLLERLAAQAGARVEAKDLAVLTHELLLAEAGEEAAHRYLVWEEFTHSERPLLLLVGGATGVGKSTITSQLSHRLEILRVQSTDMLREVMRMLVPQRLVPVLHRSSFRAWEDLPTKEKGGKEPDAVLLDGFRSQAELLQVACEAVLQRAIQERLSLLLEGVHVLPSLADRVPRASEAIVVPVMVAVLRPNVLRRRIRGRGKQAPNRRAKRYLDHFDAIWRIQGHLLGEADRAGVPIVSNDDVDGAVAEVINLVMTELAKHFHGKPDRVLR